MDGWTWFGIVATVGSVLLVVLVVRAFSRIGAPIEGGVRATAVVQGIADTGTTISTPRVGADAPQYAFDLLVSPSGGTPFPADLKQPVPRLLVPFVAPGVVVPVELDPRRPGRLRIVWEDFDAMAQRPGAGAVAPDGAVTVRFVDGAPVAGTGELFDAVRSGTMPTETASAADLLARGARGTAEVTRAMPLGTRVRDVFPQHAPADADDPIWVLTLRVELPGQPPFPAMVGHRVPAERVPDVVPGLRVPVAVDLADRHGKVAIDWGEAD